MKKQFVIILIIVEIVGILAVGLLYAKWRSSYCVYAVEIPEGMQLTTNKSLELNTIDGAVSIKEGEIVFPIGAVKKNRIRTLLFGYVISITAIYALLVVAGLIN